MGMYDTLICSGGNGNQIKIFPLAIFYPNDMGDSFHIGFMGGNLRYFSQGDDVPYKTLSYKYPKNFIAVDACEFDEPKDFIVHFFKDGKFEQTIESMYVSDPHKALSDINFSDYLCGEEVFAVDYHGNRIHNIHCAKDIEDYSSSITLYRKAMSNVYKSDSMKRYMNSIKNVSLNEAMELKREWDAEERQMRSKVKADFSNFLDTYCQETEEDRNENIFHIYGGYFDILLSKYQRYVDSSDSLDRKARRDELELIISESEKFAEEYNVSKEEYISKFEIDSDLMEKIENIIATLKSA